MGEGGKDREFGDVDLDLKEEIDETLDKVLVLLVGPQQDRALYADTVVLEPPDPVPYYVGRVEYCLVDIPRPGVRRKPEHLVVIEYRVGDPFLF